MHQVLKLKSKAFGVKSKLRLVQIPKNVFENICNTISKAFEYV